MGFTDFVIGTWNDGFHVVDMKRGVDKVHLFKGMMNIGMTLVDNRQILVGGAEWNKIKGWIN